MALPVMNGSAFQITAVSFSQPTVAYGESVTMTVTVKNVSGVKVTKVCVWGYATIPTVDYEIVAGSGLFFHTVNGPMFYFAGTDYADDSTFQTVSWAANASMTFSGQVIINNPSPYYQDKIALPEYHWGANKSASSSKMTSEDIGIRFDVYQPNVNNGSCSNINLQGSADELLHIISRRDNPKLTFAVDRATNGVLDDEGQGLLSDIKLTADSTYASFSTHGYTRSITCTPAPTGSCALSATIQQMWNGITDSSSIISGTFNNGTDYTLTVKVSNAYESVSATATISKSFANIHLSGQPTGGVCFGGFSSAGSEIPKFESYFPAYLYGGIEHLAISRWADLTYASGFDAYSGHEPRVTRVGCMIFLDGMITTTVKSATTSSAIPMATLPSWACPRVRVNALMQGSTYYLWWLTIDPTGTISVQRYRSTGSTSYTTVSAGAQLPIHACWIAADAYTEDADRPVTITPASYSASTTYSSDYPIANAFNGSGSKAWASQGSDANKSISITLPKFYKNITVSIFSRASSNGGVPSAITCTLGTSASALATGTAKTVSLDSATQKLTTCTEIARFNMENTTGYTFIKLEFTNGSTQSYVAIGYITLQGVPN